MDRLRRLFHALQTIFLSFLRLFYDPGQTRDFLSYVYTYRPLPYDKRVKCAALPEILPEIEKTAVMLRKCFPQHGNMTGEEIIAICLLVRWTNPSGIFEFGTFNGNTTLQMAINAPPDCKIYTLNLPLDHGETQLVSSAQDRMVHPKIAGSGQAFRDEPERARITELFGDSAAFDYKPYYGRCDFVLVDAGHEYNYVKSDTENALKLLPSDGGVIVWHDFPNAPGVCAWLEECSGRFLIYHVRNTRLAFMFAGHPSRGAGVPKQL
jgi:predicted O-methyltransferase YrrM